MGAPDLSQAGACLLGYVYFKRRFEEAPCHANCRAVPCLPARAAGSRRVSPLPRRFPAAGNVPVRCESGRLQSSSPRTASFPYTAFKSQVYLY